MLATMPVIITTIHVRNSSLCYCKNGGQGREDAPGPELSGSSYEQVETDAYL